MPRVLLIDDDASLLEVLTLALEDEGYTVDRAGDGTRGMATLTSDPPDLVISDVNMPGVDGFTLCRRARATGFTAPIVLLTSRDDELDEALGLELGADDYVAKPFSTRVLLARVAALLRRSQVRLTPAATPVLRAGALEIDPERLQIRWMGAAIETTVTEFRMIEVLARRPGVVFTRGRLLEQVRGDDSVVAERIVDTYVKRLRRKLEAADPGFDRIETVIGAGYRWRG